MQSSDEEDLVVIRRPRTFKQRISYSQIQETYEFNEKFRLSFENFSVILNTIEPMLHHPTKRNHALSPKEQLQIALHWFGSGVQYHCIADMHGVSKGTVCRVIKNVVNAINENLLNDTVRWPEDVGETINAFSNIAGMPLTCGIVDGTLIKIDAPSNDEPVFVDRKGHHSINVLLICGPNLEFYYVNANWPGSVSDARVLRNSYISDRMEEGWRPFPGAVLLGDSIYPLKSWLIPPVLQNAHDPAQTRFLRAHKKTRRVVECAIGRLREKFPCLNYLRVNPVYACNIIKCAVALSNLAMMEAFVVNDAEDEDHVVEGVDEYAEGAEEKLHFFYNHFRN
jgi:hypothetical protein